MASHMIQTLLSLVDVFCYTHCTTASYILHALCAFYATLYCMPVILFKRPVIGHSLLLWFR